jgi:hypothetical protein
MKHFSNINLNLNELQYAVIQNLSTVPITASIGQIYYDTIISKLKLYTAAGWVTISTGTSGGVGPGTINRVSKFITISSIGDSLIEDNASSVIVNRGTGFISSYTFDVNGTIFCDYGTNNVINVPSTININMPYYNLVGGTPDACIININGKGPLANGYMTGYNVQVSGPNNAGFFGDFSDTSAASIGIRLDSRPLHTGDFVNYNKYIGSTPTIVHKIDNTGNITSASYIKTGGTALEYLMADGSVSTGPSIPTIGTWGTLNYPTWTTGTPFVKMTAAGTFALDTTVYYPNSNPANFVSNTFVATNYVPYIGATGSINIGANDIFTLGGAKLWDDGTVEGTTFQFVGLLGSLQSAALSNEAWLLPNQSGTIALLSDITAATNLDAVLTNGNISQIDAKVGGIFLYNPNVPSGNGYVYITGDKNRFNFYNNANINLGNIQQDTLVLIDSVVPTRQFQIKKPAAIGANRIATFQDADGTVAYLSDITPSPLTTKGDLYTFSTVDARLPVGTDGQILTANSSVPEGLSWQDNYADWTSTVKHIVKNNGLSGTITKGTAVYVTSSNGTNMLVGRASNTSEATSSKTMGLMQSNITTTGGTQTGFVITEGLLGGLNTATATAGDPVWLGVNGALIYGLASKPYAPAHLVFIGIVTKVSAGNGEIFVKVQNGFELKEIHDVDLISNTPTNGQVLTYEALSGLWKNQNVPAELPTQTGEAGKFLFTNGTSQSWNFPSRHYKLGFNNIPDYVVVGGSGVQNLGGGTLGMSLTQDLSTLLYAISGSNYVINCRVITAEQFGGVTNQIGLRVTYSSANGALSTDQLLIANRINQFGTNFAIQIANLNFNIPINYLGAPTNYFKFEVIMNRTVGGNTSVFASELIFST